MYTVLKFRNDKLSIIAEDGDPDTNTELNRESSITHTQKDDIFSVLCLYWNYTSVHLHLRSVLVLDPNTKFNRAESWLNDNPLGYIDLMSQPVAPWNPDNYGNQSGSVGPVTFYNPAEFQNNVPSNQFAGTSFQPLPEGNTVSTITDQPITTAECNISNQQAQLQTVAPTIFQPSNCNNVQPANQVPPDKDSLNQLNASTDSNNTVNGTWDPNPAWGDHSSSFFGNQFTGMGQYHEHNVSSVNSVGNDSHGNNISGHEQISTGTIQYFDQNQNLPAGMNQDLSGEQMWPNILSPNTQQWPSDTSNNVLPQTYFSSDSSNSQPTNQSNYSAYQSPSPMLLSTPVQDPSSSLQTPGQKIIATTESRYFSQTPDNNQAVHSQNSWPQVSNIAVSKPLEACEQQTTAAAFFNQSNTGLDNSLWEPTKNLSNSNPPVGVFQPQNYPVLMKNDSYPEPNSVPVTATLSNQTVAENLNTSVAQAFSVGNKSQSIGNSVQNSAASVAEVSNKFNEISLNALSEDSVPTSTEAASFVQQNHQQQHLPLDSITNVNLHDSFITENKSSNSNDCSQYMKHGLPQSTETPDQEFINNCKEHANTSSQVHPITNAIVLDSFNTENSNFQNEHFSFPQLAPSSTIKETSNQDVIPKPAERHHNYDPQNEIVAAPTPPLEELDQLKESMKQIPNTSNINNTFESVANSKKEMTTKFGSEQTTSLRKDHMLNVFVSEIQPRESSPFQPPPPRQNSVEGNRPQSISRGSSQESSRSLRSSVHGESSSKGNQSLRGSANKSDPSLQDCWSNSGVQSFLRQGSQESIRSVESSTSRPSMEQIEERAKDTKSLMPPPKNVNRHDQTSAAIRANAVDAARLQDCMSPMTTLWDNPQISSSGIILVPSMPVVSSESSTAFSLVAKGSSTTSGNKNITAETSVASKLSLDATNDTTNNSSDKLDSSQPLTSTPNSSKTATSNHDSSPIKPEFKNSPQQYEEGHTKKDFHGSHDPHSSWSVHDARFPQNSQDRPDFRGSRDSLDIRDSKGYRDHDFHGSRESLDLRDSKHSRDYRDREPVDFRGSKGRDRDYRHPREYDYDYRMRYHKNPRYDVYYDRPLSRSEFERYGEYNSYYRDEEHHESYERPRSRQAVPPDENDDTDSRSERPSSRLDYSRYDREYYSRHKDPYGRRYHRKDYDPSYYRNAAYYNYYRDRYGRGYYDDAESYYNRYYQDKASVPGQYSSLPEMYDYEAYYNYYETADWPTPEETSGRMTPAKFFTTHTCAVFGPSGQLIHVPANLPSDGQPATVEIMSVENVLADQKEAEELHSFPGPLIRGETHKNDVLLFCQSKVKEYGENIRMTDRESAILLWKFLELLIKQNGTIVGTDIADLLLEDHVPNTSDYGDGESKAESERESTQSPATQENSALQMTTTSDRVLVNRSMDLNEKTDRFRNLLLYGRKKEALRWATKNNLWGHALFLASKMDNRTHAEIMTKFANSAIKMNDPLQTLYQLMSGRQPASVTSLCDDAWGDWRPHLAMMLSNHSMRPDHDKKSIITLGDTLAAKGFLHASHFCYLMAQVHFGTYSKKTSKIVLIGSSHSLSLKEFATNEAIQCTEIFEYAQSLGNPHYFLPSFQPYKLLYACRLAEYGLTQEALHYCEVITLSVISNPVYYQLTVVKVLNEISNRLKCYDPQHLQQGDMSDPVWLQQLGNICKNFEEGAIQPLSGSATPLGPQTTATSSESGEVANYLNNMQDSLVSGYSQGAMGSYIQDPQWGAPSISAEAGYSGEQHQHQPFLEQHLSNNNYFNNSVSAQQHSQQQVLQHQQQYQQQLNGQQQFHGNAEYSYNYTQQQQQQQQQQQPQESMYNYQEETDGLQNSNYHQNAPQETVGSDAHLGARNNTSDNQAFGSQEQQVSAISGTQSWEKPLHPPQAQNITQGSNLHSEEGVSGDQVASSTTETTNSEGGGFDYFGSSTHKPIIAPTRYGNNRQRTISESSNVSNGSANSVKMASPKKTNNAAKPKPVTGETKGWWNSLNIFSQLGRQKKNEMILPEDKNPAIVWDAERKKWINTGEDEEPEAETAPPPKDIDLNKPSIPEAGPPPSTGNKFALPRARGTRPQYVDVMNPNATAQTVPENLFNVLPPTSSAAPTQSIFVPPGTSNFNETNASTNNSQNETTNQQELSELSRSSSMSSLSQEVQQLTLKQQAVPVSSDSTNQTPSGRPMLFNPASFQKQSQPTAATGAGSRLSQRRIYPK
ncbi:protein transport protein Sec16A isoform X6 [Octopus bimaculoides]|uniref:protein transport protein Sec16A isoform X6 n=1 Tax=Octopus bimaculoides TaxID=37653 RepID=UPI0022E64E6E|nr:protein transport protein Sec16A isoform X6 [Octopus bimaculoides]